MGGWEAGREERTACRKPLRGAAEEPRKAKWTPNLHASSPPALSAALSLHALYPHPGRGQREEERLRGAIQREPRGSPEPRAQGCHTSMWLEQPLWTSGHLPTGSGFGRKVWTG